LEWRAKVTGRGPMSDQREKDPRGSQAAVAVRGAIDAGGRLFNIPPVVLVLAGILIAVFAASILAPRAVLWMTGGAAGLSPARLFAGPGANGGLVGWLSPLVTHIFLHAGLAHLLFNSLWLVVFGTPLARRLDSPFRFLSFFVLSGAAGGVFYAAFHSADPTILIGASGGVTGLLGGLVRFAFQNPVRGASFRYRVPLLDRSVLAWSGVVIAINASVAVLGPGVGAQGVDVAWQAHVGGYLFGLIAYPLFDRRA